MAQVSETTRNRQSGSPVVDRETNRIVGYGEMRNKLNRRRAKGETDIWKKPGKHFTSIRGDELDKGKRGIKKVMKEEKKRDVKALRLKKKEIKKRY